MANTVKNNRKAQTAKNAEQTTELAVSTGASFLPTKKEDVPQAIAILEEKLKALRGDTENVISTDIMYDMQNIKEITTVKELMAISASIRARSAAFDAEVKFYGLEGKIKNFTESDKTAEEWFEIIRKAKDELINSSQIKIVEKSIERLSKFLSEETKLANELKGIMDEATAVLE